MYYPFDDLFKKASMQMENNNTKLVDPNFDALNRNQFKQAIPYINQMDEHSLAILIKNNLDIISKDILENDPVYIPLLTNKYFIQSFIRAVNSIPIDSTLRLACNKITYDYFTSENPDFEIKRQYLNMSKIVNKDVIIKLKSIGLDDNTACNLALCRYSSPNEKTNVKRLNFAIYHRDPNIMSEQTIVWIYEKLFTRISDLFQATMFEVYTEQQQFDFGENFMENYGTVGLAILTILNNMTSDNINRVLIGYESEWVYQGRPATRFSLHALSGDYSRITRVVEYLTSIGKLIP